MNLLTFFLDYFEHQYFILKLKLPKIEILYLYLYYICTYFFIQIKFVIENVKLLGLENYKFVYIFKIKIIF